MQQLPASLDFIPEEGSSVKKFGAMLNKTWQLLSINWNSMFPATVYTPVITAGSGVFTSVSAIGRYRVIGKLIFFQLAVTITTNGTAAVQVNATLPFASVNVTDSDYCLYGRANAVSGKQLQGIIGPNASTLSILNYDGTYPGANGEKLYVSGFYEIN